jgi:hypothetical protein
MGYLTGMFENVSVVNGQEGVETGAELCGQSFGNVFKPTVGSKMTVRTYLRMVMEKTYWS